MNRFHFAFIGIITFIGCTTEPNQNPIQFIVRVDSISHQASVRNGDTITIQLFGTIGSDGCHSFSKFEDLKAPNRVDLTVWGQRIPANACPAVMVYLNGREYHVPAIRQGWYFINIHQPDGTILRDSLIVN
jgi:hypothetical protein